MPHVLCPKGHYYDPNKFSECHICAFEREENKGQFVPPTGTVPFPPSDETTVLGPDGRPIKLLPVIGWLVVVKGPGRGRDFRLVPGNNYIGRDRGMQVCLEFGQNSDQTVSRENHAVIVHDSVDNATFVNNCNKSDNLPRLNGKRISSETELKQGDILLLGNTELMYIPLCGQDFAWENYPMAD
jgi:hypothetical protein